MKNLIEVALIGSDLSTNIVTMVTLGGRVGDERANRAARLQASSRSLYACMVAQCFLGKLLGVLTGTWLAYSSSNRCFDDAEGV
jgi:hypothetical protein